MCALSCWVVTDGKVGMENQCVGLAQALGLTPAVKRVRLRTPWKQLSPFLLRIGNRWSLAADSDRLDAPLPDLMIATGRHSVSSSLEVGRMSGGRTFRVQIQDPGIDPRHFDLVVVPQHDRLRGPNVVVTTGALHKVTAENLQAAAGRFADRLDHLPRPRLAVLVGGNSGVHRLTPEITERLADQLAATARAHDAALLVTASRRTGADNEAVLRRRLAGLPGEIWDGRGENPYLGYLAAADAVVVTADSVNMVCEACSTGKPVYIVELEGGSDKFRRFHRGLQASGMTRSFDGSLDRWTYQPLDDTRRVAEILRRKLGER